MDIEIACDMLEIAEHADHLVLFSGDGDFRRLIEDRSTQGGARHRGVDPMRSSPPMTSDELRRQADTFVDLADLASVIGRPRQNHTPTSNDGARMQVPPIAEEDFEDVV